MNLQERQKRAIEALKKEIVECFEWANFYKAVELIAVLALVASDPETYFKNIDEQE